MFKIGSGELGQTARGAKIGGVLGVRAEAGVAGAEILTWCREQMANYKVPRAIELVDELPLNATGKVVKDELRARVSNGRPVSAP